MDTYQVLPPSSFGFICRTCLIHDELFQIEDVSWEGIDLMEILKNWTTLDVDENEQLPKKMCNNCIKLMYQTYQFLSKCKRAEWTLKSIVLKNQSENPSHMKDSSTALEGQMENPQNKDKSERQSVETDIVISTSEENNRQPETTTHDTRNDDSSEFVNIIGCSDAVGNVSLITQHEDSLMKVKTEMSSNESDEEISFEYDPENSTLTEIENIKSDIDKIRAYNYLKLHTMKTNARLLTRGTKGLKSRNKGPPYKCITCNESFPSMQEVKKHRNETHKKYFPFKCEYCDSRYDQKYHLEAHTRIHTGEKPFSCETCGESFTFESVLKRHEVVHMEVKPYQCGYCQKGFVRKHLLEAHERKHTGSQLLCKYCNNEFDTPTTLRQHVRNEHSSLSITPPTEDGWKCQHCGKILQSEKTLNDHILLHGPRDFVCATCSKGFTTIERLQLHIKMTHESTMFECELCGKIYRQKSGLMGHLETHHEKKHHTCNACGKTFVFKGSLRQHERLHQGDTTYQCKTCLHICPNKRRLEAHIRTHTGERPFACEICGKRFSEKANFVAHQKIHKKELENYVCNICEKLFLDIRSLKKHIHNTHIDSQ